jgi:hypothetical protein
MSDSYLLPGKTRAYSDPIVIPEGSLGLVSVYVDGGGDVGSGPALKLQVQDINLKFVSVNSPEFGTIIFNDSCQQFVIATPGTYRVYRPNISAWDYDIGVEVYIYLSA